ncbi:MAG: M20 family metallopeptidase [Rhodospirillaceae bacterium]|nr:M20 family metallopeptidase [Rhodospirillaceae bacterium]MDD9918878.1 M20 family metallopeptidase [Rhodospirillaceae bacterium]
MSDQDKQEQRRKIEALTDELQAIRRDIHKHPETAYEENRTADIVAERLESWGLEVHRGLGGTGVVGTLRKGDSNRAVGFRADMDALFIQEKNTFDHRSVHDGKMHACGHDGHTTMLLGAARYLSESERFNGVLHFIFQPAEEGEAGAKAMIDDGLFDLFPCDAVYGLHNMPGIEAGHIGLRAGPILAASDRWTAEFRGSGGHGSMPHKGTDPTVAAAQFITAMQTIVSRNVDPIDTGAISVGHITGGDPGSLNIIPSDVLVGGTARSFTDTTRDLIERRLGEVAEAIAGAHGCEVDVSYIRGYPATVNWREQTEIATRAAEAAVGAARTDPNLNPLPGGEDFSFMLQQVPGCYAFIGNGFGEPDEFVHAPRYDFNDEIISSGVNYWVELAEAELDDMS